MHYTRFLFLLLLCFASEIKASAAMGLPPVPSGPPTAAGSAVMSPDGPYKSFIRMIIGKAADVEADAQARVAARGLGVRPDEALDPDGALDYDVAINEDWDAAAAAQGVPAHFYTAYQKLTSRPDFTEAKLREFLAKPFGRAGLMPPQAIAFARAFHDAWAADFEAANTEMKRVHETQARQLEARARAAEAARVLEEANRRAAEANAAAEGLRAAAAEVERDAAVAREAAAAMAAGQAADRTRRLLAAVAARAGGGGSGLTPVQRESIGHLKTATEIWRTIGDGDVAAAGGAPIPVFRGELRAFAREWSSVIVTPSQMVKVFATMPQALKDILVTRDPGQITDYDAVLAAAGYDAATGQPTAAGYSFADHYPAAHQADELIGAPLTAEEIEQVRHFTEAIDGWDVALDGAFRAGPAPADVPKLRKLQRFVDLWRQPDVHPRQKTAVLAAAEMPAALRDAILGGDVGVLGDLVGIIDNYDAGFRFEEQIPHVKYPIAGIVRGAGGGGAALTPEETAHVENMTYALGKWRDAAAAVGGGGGDPFPGQVTVFTGAWLVPGVHDRQKLALFEVVPAAYRAHIEARTDAVLEALDNLRVINDNGTFVLADHMPANHPAPAGGGAGDGIGAADAGLLAGRDFTDPDELFQLVLEIATIPGLNLVGNPNWGPVVRLMGDIASRVHTVESSKFKPRLAVPFQQLAVPVIAWGDYADAVSLFDSTRKLVRTAWGRLEDADTPMFDFAVPVPTGDFPDFPLVTDSALPQLLELALDQDSTDAHWKFSVNLMRTVSPGKISWFADAAYDAAVAGIAAVDPAARARAELEARIGNNDFIASMGRLLDEEGVLNVFRTCFAFGLDLGSKLVDSKNSGISLLGKVSQWAAVDSSLFKHPTRIFSHFWKGAGGVSETGFIYELAAAQRGTALPTTQAAYEAMLSDALDELGLGSMHAAIRASRIPFTIAPANAAANYENFKRSLRGSMLDFLVWTTLLATDQAKIAQFEAGTFDGVAIPGFAANATVGSISAYLRDLQVTPADDSKYRRKINLLRLLERMRRTYSSSLALGKKLVLHPATAKKIKNKPGILNPKAYDNGWDFENEDRTYAQRFRELVFVRTDEPEGHIRSAHDFSIVEPTPAPRLIPGREPEPVPEDTIPGGLAPDPANPDHFYWKVLKPLYANSGMVKPFAMDSAKQYANIVRFVIAIDPDDANVLATWNAAGFDVLPETDAYIRQIENFVGQRDANIIATTTGHSYPRIIRDIKARGDAFDRRVGAFISDGYLERLQRIIGTLGRLSTLSGTPATELDDEPTADFARDLLALTAVVEKLRPVNPVTRMASELNLNVGSKVSFVGRENLVGPRGQELLRATPDGLSASPNGFNLLRLVAHTLKPDADRSYSERRLLPVITENVANKRRLLLRDYLGAVKYANLDALLRHLKFFKLKEKFAESLGALADKLSADLPWVVMAAGAVPPEMVPVKAWVDAWSADAVHGRQKLRLYEYLFEDGGPSPARLALKAAVDTGAALPHYDALVGAGGALEGVDFAIAGIQPAAFPAGVGPFGPMPVPAMDRPKVEAIDRLVTHLSVAVEASRSVQPAPLDARYTDISRSIRENVEGALRRIVGPYIWGPGEPTAEERARYGATPAAPMNIIAGDRVLDYTDDAWGIAPDNFRSATDPAAPESFGIFKYSSRKLVFGFEDALAVARGMASEPDDPNIRHVYGGLRGLLDQLHADYTAMRNFANEGQDQLTEAEALDERDLNLAPDFTYRVDAWGVGRPGVGGGVVAGIDPHALQLERTHKSQAAALAGLGGGF